MAQKATKLLAARNATTLRRTHLISLGCHILYLLLRLLLFRASFTRTSVLLYFVLCTPSFAIEFWLERIGRPTYTTPSSTGERSVQKAGEDLEAKGLTEFLWDVLYWTWGCVVLAAVVGDRAWWAWVVVVPAYSVYLAVGTYRGVTGGGGLGGMMMGGGGAGAEGLDGVAGGESKRQKKMEKRGGREKVQYR